MSVPTEVEEIYHDSLSFIGTVYSNLNHSLDSNIVANLRADPNENYAQHSAWDFCGYIFKVDDGWTEVVWRYKSPVVAYRHDDLAELIEFVNSVWGYD